MQCFLFLRPCVTGHADRQPQAGQAREDLKNFTEHLINSYITGAAERAGLTPCTRKKAMRLGVQGIKGAFLDPIGSQ